MIDNMSEQQEGVVWSQSTIADMARVLGAVPFEISDTESVPGARLIFPDRPDISIDIYPDQQLLQLETGSTQMTLRRIAAPIITDDQVVVSQEASDGQMRHFSLTSRGEVTLIEVLSSAASTSRPIQQIDDKSYVEMLATEQPPSTVDEYGFDEQEMRRLLDEGLGGRIITGI